MKKTTGILKNWKLDYSFATKTYFISGNIYNDIKCRFKDGEWVRTSRVLEINFKENFAKTKNSIYKLDVCGL